MLSKAKDFMMKKRQGKNGKMKRSRARKILEEGGQFVGGLKGLGGLGRYAGTKIADLIGAGAYRVRRGVPRRQNRKVRSLQLAPKTGPLDKVFTIQHREYIQDVSTSTNFSSLTFNLNPGIQQTFPWLSTMAPCFQKYKFRQCVFQLVSNSAFAVSSTNTALGCWGAVTQVDASDPPLATKQQAENYQGCESCVPARSLTHQVECARRDASYKWYFVRTGALGPNEDIKTYDEGVFNYFSQGAQAASVAGELWVTYTVDFMIPSLPNGGTVAYSDEFYGTAANTSNPLGTTATYNPNNNIGILVTPTQIQFPATAPQGNYLIVMQVSYAGAQAVPTISITPDGTSMVAGSNIFNAMSANAFSSPASSVSAASRTFVTNFSKVQQSKGNLTVAITHPATATVEIFVTLLNPLLPNLSMLTLKQNEIKQIKDIISQYKDRLTVDPEASMSHVSYDDGYEDDLERRVSQLKNVRGKSPHSTWL